jgi:hypothetical protein
MILVAGYWDGWIEKAGRTGMRFFFSFLHLFSLLEGNRGASGQGSGKKYCNAIHIAGGGGRDEMITYVSLVHRSLGLCDEIQVGWVLLLCLICLCFV